MRSSRDGKEKEGTVSFPQGVAAEQSKAEQSTNNNSGSTKPRIMER